MTTVSHPVDTSLQWERRGLTTRVAGAVSSLWRAFRNRRAFQQLTEMSEAQLADIGLVRSDLRLASDLRFGHDPTACLRLVARERIRETEALARLVH